MFLLLSGLSPYQAHAGEPLVFKDSIPLHAQISLRPYFEDDHTDFKAVRLALSDLNSDGLDEYIVKTGSCLPGQESCAYKILAQSGNKIIEIGTLQAGKIILANSSTAGIRDILVQRGDSLNDFRHGRYVWEPGRGRYILANGDEK